MLIWSIVASAAVSIAGVISPDRSAWVRDTPEHPALPLDTGGAFGDPMGALGFDLCPEQSAAVHFRPLRDTAVGEVSVWLMSHRFNGEMSAPIVASIRQDDRGRPSSALVAAVELPPLRGGWRPERVATSFDPVVLLGGRDYWLVLDCDASLGEGAIWCFAGTYARSANTYGAQMNWQPAGYGPVGAASLLGEDGCYADCAGPEGLDLRDFVCFQSRFLAADRRACDCDLSTGESRCDIFDFLCFQDRFVRGCG